MKNSLIGLLVIATLLCVHCGPGEEIDTQLAGLVELNLPYDTIRVDSEFESLVLGIFGTFYSEEVIELNVTGLFSSHKETRLVSDTIILEVNRKAVLWESSDTKVVDVNNGRLNFKKAGTATVWARSGSVTSNEVFVKVEGTAVTVVYEAPKLQVNPPYKVLTFSSTGVVDGSVTVGSDLFVNEAKSTYDASGLFNTGVSGLKLGENTVMVEAINPLDETKRATGSKTIIYQEPSASHSIVGPWQGTAAGYDFYFDVAYNSKENRFDIIGKLILEILSQNINEEIAFEGLVDEYGQMKVVIEQTKDLLTVKGGIKGFFSDNGTAAGEVFLKSEVLLFQKKESGDWTAEKVD